MIKNIINSANQFFQSPHQINQAFIKKFSQGKHNMKKELQKRREGADSDLKKQYQLRQSLIEKNLSGIYSDDIFKEQNTVIEEKVKSIQFSKNDALIDKYSIEPITKFVETKLTNFQRP